MKRYSKILLCAVLTTAFLFSFVFSCFGASDYVLNYLFGGVAPPATTFVQVNANNDYVYISTDELTNLNVDSFDFAEFGMNHPGHSGPICYPFICRPFDSLSGSYNSYGYAASDKGWNPYDLGSVDAYCTSFEFNFAFGFEDVEGEDYSSFESPLDCLLIIGDEEVSLGAFEVVDSREEYLMVHTTDGLKPFFVKLFRYRFTFDEPYELKTLGETRIKPQVYSLWNGYPSSDPMILTAFSSFYVSYVLSENLEDYREESVVISNNNDISNINNQIGSINEKLDLDKPTDNSVNNVLSDIDSSTVGDFGDLSGINDSSHTNFNHFVNLMSISVLGVAFIGYVLHGKRG